MGANTNNRVERDGHLRWIAISEIRYSALAQRNLNMHRVIAMEARIDIEQIGNPVLSQRADGSLYCMDGMHRIEMLKLHGWGDQQLQCHVFTGLSEAEEAEFFLRLNDRLTVDAFAKFRIAVTAGREVETDVQRITMTNGMHISQDRQPGSIGCVGTLRKVYLRGGGPALGRTLRIARDAYGDGGMQSVVLDGLGLVTQRFNGELPETVAIAKLAKVHGGVNGLLHRAHKVRETHGAPLPQCVAAVVIDVVNEGTKAADKLPGWWTPKPKPT